MTTDMQDESQFIDTGLIFQDDCFAYPRIPKEYNFMRYQSYPLNPSGVEFIGAPFDTTPNNYIQELENGDYELVNMAAHSNFECHAFTEIMGIFEIITPRPGGYEDHRLLNYIDNIGISNTNLEVHDNVVKSHSYDEVETENPNDGNGEEYFYPNLNDLTESIINDYPYVAVKIKPISEVANWIMVAMKDTADNNRWEFLTGDMDNDIKYEVGDDLDIFDMKLNQDKTIFCDTSVTFYWENNAWHEDINGIEGDGEDLRIIVNSGTVDVPSSWKWSWVKGANNNRIFNVHLTSTTIKNTNIKPYFFILTGCNVGDYNGDMINQYTYENYMAGCYVFGQGRALTVWGTSKPAAGWQTSHWWDDNYYRFINKGYMMGTAALFCKKAGWEPTYYIFIGDPSLRS